jgi:hypothetical protein
MDANGTPALLMSPSMTQLACQVVAAHLSPINTAFCEWFQKNPAQYLLKTGWSAQMLRKSFFNPKGDLCKTGAPASGPAERRGSRPQSVPFLVRFWLQTAFCRDF